MSDVPPNVARRAAGLPPYQQRNALIAGPSSIRIVSDGTGAGTKVLDAKGDEMQMVAEVRWCIRARGLAMATVTFLEVPVDVVGERQTLLERMDLPDPG